ncbi:MAG: DNA-binding response regulator [Sphingomonas bacterium]|nr:DNA-binding response regulator [Sphingomonas bacterium]
MTNAALILIVDDEPPIRRLLRGALERAGYRAIEAGTAKEAMALVAAEDPAVILLDLGLPDRDGMELIPIIGKQSQATILIISARDATEEKVAALDLGAADYVTKPFDTEELLARVRAALRHRLTADGGQTLVTIGGVTIDLLDRRVTRDGVEIHLTPKEFVAMAELARFPGRVITHQVLLRAIWPNDYERHVEYLRVLIRNMRQKLEIDPARPALIVNELGVGYRLSGMTA